MPEPIVDQVVDFHANLFERIFAEPFRPRISDRLRRNAVARQIEESADAASQSLSRFFLNQQLTPAEVSDLLAGLQALGDLLDLERVSNPNVIPESVVEELLRVLPLPEAVRQAGNEAVCRVALHSIVQVLMLVGPVMAEWQRLNFSSTFELPRRVVNRLNQISEQLDLLGRGESLADERYELTYRDYLLQRFHRVEAGTVRMTTNLAVDLRELFVMPRVQERAPAGGSEGTGSINVPELMNLAAARKIFQDVPGSRLPETPDQVEGLLALDQAKKIDRLVLVGAPGSGKSTFLEWLQLKLASVEEELILEGQQAIPLLLRVRQLDPLDLPQGAALIERATASRDRASLMPPGWIERQMQKGRVFFLLDGLDEAEPELRDLYLIPWLQDLCLRYPACHYLVSSRPVGYPPGSLYALGFVECDLLDFGSSEVAEYARHWCTAVRLARNEPEAEARTEGAADGGKIVSSFKEHPYVRNLARNPLMLSAICLVNYFESSELPKDRAFLYRLCVEGLLHHWDQRRGIRSEFTLEEKLQACRHVALAMQSQDKAECTSEEVENIFGGALGDPGRGLHLLEHVRFRTGLLVERRARVFAFAHLTFQEYLAACAVHEGNPWGIEPMQLSQEHGDGRWNEVIALYCGLAPKPAARQMLKSLLEQPASSQLGSILENSYFSAGAEVTREHELRQIVIRRLVVLPYRSFSTVERFPRAEVAAAASELVFRGEDSACISQACSWLVRNAECPGASLLLKYAQEWHSLNSAALSELMMLVHFLGEESAIKEISLHGESYSRESTYELISQGEVALLAISARPQWPRGIGFALLEILSRVSKIPRIFHIPKGMVADQEIELLPTISTLARRIVENDDLQGDQDTRSRFLAWVEDLEIQCETRPSAGVAKGNV